MKERIIYNSKGEKEYLRFGLNFRLQHIGLMVSTILLIVTGLPLKFFTAGWAKFIMSLFGGTEGARQFHHLAALGLIIVGIYHLGFIIFSKTGRMDFKELIPTKKDFTDFWSQVKSFFSKSKSEPKFGRFSFIEKFDYWAVYWGFVIMIGSGIVMWLFQGRLNPWLFGEIDLSALPLKVDNYFHAISREAHSDEALLATLAIIVWHFYNVHFNPDKFPGSKVWLSGKMSWEEMEKEHPLELEQIEKENQDQEESKQKKEIQEENQTQNAEEIRDEKESQQEIESKNEKVNPDEQQVSNENEKE
jgi:cytochrome b subunit of formate dehydrogenase